ncbi:MAG: UDP-N-acetylmuramate--L-alanine ligase [Candidatus Paceibacterota bacterium]
MKLFNKIKRIHMVGIKGTGMSTLAVNLKHMGIKVSGSDYPESFFTDELLKKQKIKVMSPFAAKNISPQTDAVVISTAYNNKNDEVQEAEKRGLTILTYPEVIGSLTKKLKSIAVCGSHGKTTTSGLLGYIFSQTKFKPLINVGSIVPQLINYKASPKTKLFIFEADEYQNKFEYYQPHTVILTNIDYDHPDYFKSPRHYKSIFKEFVKKIPRNGLLIYCADDKDNRDVAKNTSCKKIGYGFSNFADYQIVINEMKPGNMSFAINAPKLKNTKFSTRLIGQHNALNATAAVLCASNLGVSLKETASALKKFNGTKRRLEVIKTSRIKGHECLQIDDFAHHPTEIRNTLRAIKTAYPGTQLWTVFQPHTFSRTQALFNEFAGSFNESDKTIILDIYGSKREGTGKIHSKDLVKKIRGSIYKPGIKEAAEFIKKNVDRDCIILTAGASNIWEMHGLI